MVNTMEYYEELRLINVTFSKDYMGQVQKTETYKDIMCQPSVVGSKEFYNALAAGIRPTAELRIKGINYNNEEECEYKGVRYSILRTLPKSKTDLILVIGIKQGVN